MSTDAELMPIIPEGLSEQDRLALIYEINVAAKAVIAAMGATELTEDFTRQRDTLLAKAAACKTVLSSAEEGTANEAITALRTLERKLEDDAKSLKAPLDALGKKLLRLKETALEPIVKAKDRLRSMVSAFEQERIEAAREQQRQAEEAARKAAEEQRKAQEAAEKARLDAETAAKALESATSDKDAAEAEKQRQEALQRQQEAEEQAELAAMTPAAPAPAAVVSAPGVSARMVPDFRLNADDEFKQELCAIQLVRDGFGHFFRCEPRRSAILDALKRDINTFKGHPGIKVWQKVATTHR